MCEKAQIYESIMAWVRPMERRAMREMDGLWDDAVDWFEDIVPDAAILIEQGFEDEQCIWNGAVKLDGLRDQVVGLLDNMAEIVSLRNQAECQHCGCTRLLVKIDDLDVGNDLVNMGVLAALGVEREESNEEARSKIIALRALSEIGAREFDL